VCVTPSKLQGRLAAQNRSSPILPLKKDPLFGPGEKEKEKETEASDTGSGDPDTPTSRNRGANTPSRKAFPYRWSVRCLRPVLEYSSTSTVKTFEICHLRQPPNPGFSVKTSGGGCFLYVTNIIVILEGDWRFPNTVKDRPNGHLGSR